MLNHDFSMKSRTKCDFYICANVKYGGCLTRNAGFVNFGNVKHGKLSSHVFFRIIVHSPGLKSRLARAAGAALIGFVRKHAPCKCDFHVFLLHVCALVLLCFATGGYNSRWDGCVNCDLVSHA